MEQSHKPQRRMQVAITTIIPSPASTAFVRTLQTFDCHVTCMLGLFSTRRCGRSLERQPWQVFSLLTCSASGPCLIDCCCCCTSRPSESSRSDIEIRTSAAIQTTSVTLWMSAMDASTAGCVVSACSAAVGSVAGPVVSGHRSGKVDRIHLAIDASEQPFCLGALAAH